MLIKKISPQFFVSEQISGADVGVAAAQGVKAIICNRPDNEVQDQPAASEVAAASEGSGVTFLDVPVSSVSITDDDVDKFERALSDLPGPILAYCRSGKRSAILWALAQAKSLDIDEILSATREAGYELSALRPRLHERSASRKK